MTANTSAPYLATLNPQQRRAVEHGGAAPREAGPLLIIAGAGSGKTNTLAHRVAHLILNGADPRRMLLLTFSRRAAAEMARRVGYITAERPARARRAAGRRHLLVRHLPCHRRAAVARIRRAHRPRPRVHDPRSRGLRRPDEPDAPRSRLFQDREALSGARAPAWRSIRARSMPRCRSTKCSAARFRGAPSGKPNCARCSRLCRGQATPARARLRRSAAVLGAHDGRARDRGRARRERFDHVLVDEYQDTNRLQAAILLALKPNGQGLTVVGDDAQSIYSFRAATVRNILDFPGHFTPRAEVVTLEQQLPLDPADPRRRQRGDRARRRALHQEPAVNARLGRAAELVTVRRRNRPGATMSSIASSNSAKPGMALKAQAVLFRASHHSGPLEVELSRRNIPFVKFGGLKFLEAAHIKDVLAFLRFAENPRDRVAGFRLLQLLPGVGPATAARALDGIAGDGGRDPCRTCAHSRRRPPPRKTGRRLSRRSAMCAAAPPDGRPNSTSPAAGTSRTSPASTMTPPCARPTWCNLPRSRELSQPRAVSHRTHARSAGLDQRPRRHAAARRGLSDPVDHPLGQRPGMEGGLPAQHRRRLHPGRPRDRQPRRNRGGAPPALCRHDTRQGPSASRRAAALLCPHPAQQRRPPHVRGPHALHSLRHSSPVRDLGVARGTTRAGGHQTLRRERRHRRPHAPDVALMA